MEYLSNPVVLLSLAGVCLVGYLWKRSARLKRDED